MWLHSQDKYGTLVNLSKVKCIYRELDTFNRVWKLKAFVNDVKNSDGIVILGVYSTEEKVDQALTYIHKMLEGNGESIIYMSNE